MFCIYRKGRYNKIKKGQLLTIIKLNQYFNLRKEFYNDEIAIKLCRIMNANYDKIQEKDNSFSFLCGFTGPLIVKALYYKSDIEKSNLYSLQVVNLLKNYSDNFFSSDTPDEVLYGRSGYLYSLIFLKRNLEYNIDLSIFDKVCSSIINSGLNNVEHGFGAPLHYLWHGKMYLGAAHGYVGILYMLLDPVCLECTSVKNNIEVIKVSCEKLFDLMYSTGNLPSSYPRNTDKLVQWCHGGPGAIYLAIRFANVFKDDKYNNFAAKMADDIWERGLLLKGSGLCHGVSGNAYSFLAMYAHTDDKKYLYRAYMFAKWMIEQEKDFHLSADEPYSLFEGLAGTLYFLCDLYKPKNALFPGFQTTIE